MAVQLVFFDIEHFFLVGCVLIVTVSQLNLKLCQLVILFLSRGTHKLVFCVGTMVFVD